MSRDKHVTRFQRVSLQARALLRVVPLVRFAHIAVIRLDAYHTDLSRH